MGMVGALSTYSMNMTGGVFTKSPIHNKPIYNLYCTFDWCLNSKGSWLGTIFVLKSGHLLKFIITAQIPRTARTWPPCFFFCFRFHRLKLQNTSLVVCDNFNIGQRGHHCYSGALFIYIWLLPVPFSVHILQILSSNFSFGLSRCFGALCLVSVLFWGRTIRS